SSASRLRWMTPRPPACAIAIAIRASVTVSMAEATIGILSAISRVMRVRRSVSDGMTCDNAGWIRTSSQVSASRRFPLEFTAIANSASPASYGSKWGRRRPNGRLVGGENTRALTRESVARFGLAEVDSTRRPAWIGPPVRDFAWLPATATDGACHAHAIQRAIRNPGALPTHALQPHRAADRGGRPCPGGHRFAPDRDLSAG